MARVIDPTMLEVAEMVWLAVSLMIFFMRRFWDCNGKSKGLKAWKKEVFQAEHCELIPLAAARSPGCVVGANSPASGEKGGRGLSRRGA